ncbi:hypothetical protein C8Q76DRAFT_219281 [Earliella scabrosa]|nr:hypothetical protein C8Q76DRAFT_219281 [Earliella scabrosa]
MDVGIGVRPRHPRCGAVRLCGGGRGYTASQRMAACVRRAALGVSARSPTRSPTSYSLDRLVDRRQELWSRRDGGWGNVAMRLGVVAAREAVDQSIENLGMTRSPRCPEGLPEPPQEKAADEACVPLVQPGPPMSTLLLVSGSSVPPSLQLYAVLRKWEPKAPECVSEGVVGVGRRGAGDEVEEIGRIHLARLCRKEETKRRDGRRRTKRRGAGISVLRRSGGGRQVGDERTRPIEEPARWHEHSGARARVSRVEPYACSESSATEWVHPTPTGFRTFHDPRALKRPGCTPVLLDSPTQDDVHRHGKHCPPSSRCQEFCAGERPGRQLINSMLSRRRKCELTRSFFVHSMIGCLREEWLRLESVEADPTLGVHKNPQHGGAFPE